MEAQPKESTESQNRETKQIVKRNKIRKQKMNVHVDKTVQWHMEDETQKRMKLFY